jgi:hypothetical protein
MPAVFAIGAGCYLLVGFLLPRLAAPAPAAPPEQTVTERPSKEAAAVPVS